jgi:hypothetical protein
MESAVAIMQSPVDLLEPSMTPALTEADESIAAMKPSFRFEEFVRLRKENKALTLQVR